MCSDITCHLQIWPVIVEVCLGACRLHVMLRGDFLTLRREDIFRTFRGDVCSSYCKICGGWNPLETTCLTRLKGSECVLGRVHTTIFGVGIVLQMREGTTCWCDLGFRVVLVLLGFPVMLPFYSLPKEYVLWNIWKMLGVRVKLTECSSFWQAVWSSKLHKQP